MSSDILITLSKKLWGTHCQMNILDHTKLGHEMFWILLQTTLDQDRDHVSLKELNAESFAAPSAIRRAARRLQSEGWVTAESHPNDERVVVLKPLESLKRHADEYLTNVRDCFSEIKCANCYKSALELTTGR